MPPQPFTPPATPFAYNSLIKNIFLELPHYKHFHQSSDSTEDYFFGRTELQTSFVDVFKKDSPRGAYLVTGYRGMGKTRFVNEALKKVEKKVPNTKTLRLSLAQSELKDIDILKQIVNQLLETVEGMPSYRFTRLVSLNNVFGWILPIIMVTLIVFNYKYIIQGGTEKDPNSIIENLLGITSVSALLTFFVYKSLDWAYSKISQLNLKGWLITSLLGFVILYRKFYYINSDLNTALTEFITEVLNIHLRFPRSYIPTTFLAFAVAITLVFGFIAFIIGIPSWFKWFRKKADPVKKIHERIKTLYNRCNAQTTSEDQFKDSISSSFSSLFKKDSLVFPIANAKEIERTFTFAVHKSVSGQIQPGLDNLKFCGGVDLIVLQSKIRRWDEQC